MSFDALAWAAKAKGIRPAEKLVLLGLAECASRDGGLAFPSIAALEEFSGLNRKTIIGALSALVERRLITETGETVGRTSQIKVYRLLLESFHPGISEKHYVYQLSDAKTGQFYIGVRSFIGSPEDDKYRGSGKWPTSAAFNGIELDREIIGTFDSRVEAEAFEAECIATALSDPLCRNIAKESHKRDRSASGNSPVFSAKQSQKRDTDTVKEPVTSEAKASSDNEQLLPEHIEETWNETAVRLWQGRTIKGLVNGRRAGVKRLIASHELGDFVAVFANIEQSKFLRGDTGWHGCTFDWVMKPANFQKILEGNYNG